MSDFPENDFVENKIAANDYDLFDKSLYGGIGHGIVVIPTNIIKILFTVIFPPLGEMLEIVNDFLLDEFPYITWKTIKVLFQFENIKFLPFLASTLVVIFTALITIQISKKRFAGIISMIILLQSITFTDFDTIAVYENFWVLFFKRN